jgi:hypothetical protein
MQKCAFNEKNSEKCRKIPWIGKCKKIPLMQKYPKKFQKCRKIPLIQKNSINSKKFHHECFVIQDFSKPS